MESSTLKAQESLIRQVESGMEPRYSYVKNINSTPNGERRGVCSLVFKAYDNIENKYVAIKFCDPAFLGNAFRVSAFEREPEIIGRISRKPRCLTMVSGLSPFQWRPDDSVASGMAGQVRIEIPIKYFSTEWIDDDVDEYFLSQHNFDGVIKLSIFRSFVLSVQAIHSEGIFHRDLKVDNLRSKDLGGEKIVVIIDFGTAARKESERLSVEYPDGSGVGAPAYTSPESLCGLCSKRDVAIHTDFWAMGAMLYELFNPGMFVQALHSRTNYANLILMLQSSMRGVDEVNKANLWKELMEKFRHAFFPPDLCGRGSTVPAAVSVEIDRIYRSLVCFDYRSRSSSYEGIIRRIDVCINILSSSARQRRALEIKRARRKNRLDKLERRASRSLDAVRGF